jgi:ribosomal protein S18 acetylase RimI-like enzyme
MGAVVIRTGELADHDDVRDLRRRSSLSNEGDRELILANPDTLEYAPTSLREGRTRVAVDGGRIVGFSTTAGDDELELEALFVEPSAMRTGVGRALVDDLVANARARGIARINVTANGHALAFYEALGFVTDGLIATRFRDAPRMHLDVV